jgi:HSP20 family protein
MANITVERQKATEPQIASPREFPGPLGLWRDFFRWDPFAQMLPSLLEREPLAFSPDFDVKETKDAFIFKADLPGVESKDVDVQTTDNRLTISGKRSQEKEEKTETTYRCERSFGSFTRAFTLPAGGDLEKIAAELKNGVLTVTVPKKPAAKAKQVDVKAT